MGQCRVLNITIVKLICAFYEERLRLLDIANGYRDDAVRVEALQGASHR